MSFAVIPRITEKGYAKAAEGMFTFVVPVTANKEQIATAVAAQYGVTVVSVNVVLQTGKAVRSYRGKGKYADGKRTDTKKAYVRLADGQKIDAFEETK
jgi:large subunit ribosomal protein L23